MRFRILVDPGNVTYYEYKIPQKIRNTINEGEIIATELMDEIIYDVFGVHFLEPIASISPQ